MSFPLDFTDDYLVWDATETVTFRERRNVRSGGDRDWPVGVALRLPVSIKEQAASGGAYCSQDVTWLFPKKLVAPGVPRPGDQVLAGLAAIDAPNASRATLSGPETWTTLAVSYSPLDETFRLTCRNVALLNDLTDLVDVWQPIQKEDTAGARVPAFIPYRIGLAARIQELTGDVVDELGQRRTRKQFNVFLADNIDLELHWQVRRQDGAVLEVKSWQNPQRIDELMVLTCEQKV